MTEYIEREFALDVIKRTSGDYVAAFAEIAHAPSADVTSVKRGKWDDGVCSECGFEATYYKNSNIQIRTKFCPILWKFYDGGIKRCPF